MPLSSFAEVGIQPEFATIPRQNLLRAGMSVYTTVDTREGAHDADDEADLDSPEMTHPK